MTLDEAIDEAKKFNIDIAIIENVAYNDFTICSVSHLSNISKCYKYVAIVRAIVSHEVIMYG